MKKMKQKQWILLALGIFLSMKGFSIPQIEELPSASPGIIERQLEKEYESKPLKPEQKSPLLDIDIPKEKLDIPYGIKVQIERVSFKGNTVFSDEKLDKIVNPYLEKELSLSEIYDLCTKIEDTYRKEGYFLVRVYPPAQKIQHGELKLEILEGYLGQIKVKDNKYYSTKYVQKFFKHLQGDPLRYQELMKALFLLNESRDLEAGCILVRGEEFGTTDLLVEVHDKLPIHAGIDYNNYGSHLTTRHRSGLRTDFGNTIFDGDNLTLIGVMGYPPDQLYFTDGIYEVPLNARGTLLRLSYLYAHSKHPNIVSDIEFSGTSQVGTVLVSQAIQRRRGLSTNIEAYFDVKQIQNHLSHHAVSKDYLRIFNLTFRLDAMDKWRGRNVLRMNLAQGIPHFLGGLKSVDSLSSRVGSGGLFTIFQLDYDRLQRLFKDHILSFHFSGQLTPYKLPLPELFYIGGVDTVRGYPLSVALGDHGYYANLEWRAPIPGVSESKVPWTKIKWKDFFQWLVFVDHGGVDLKSGAFDQSSTAFLTSAGVGFRIHGPFKFYLNWDVGFPITSRFKGPNAITYFRVGFYL